MKLVTWNVNSIRQRLPRLLALLDRHEPDVVCLQETKVEDPAFPTMEIAAAGYECATGLRSCRAWV
jgi:exodeoxyribonuclease-3